MPESAPSGQVLPRHLRHPGGSIPSASLQGIPLADCPAPPGTAKFMQPIATEAYERGEFASGSKSDEAPPSWAPVWEADLPTPLPCAAPCPQGRITFTIPAVPASAPTIAGGVKSEDASTHTHRPRPIMHGVWTYSAWGIELNPPLPIIPSSPDAWLRRPTAGEAAASKKAAHGASSAAHVAAIVAKADALTTAAVRSAVGFIVIYSPWATVSRVAHAYRCRCA
jgi:hypothetical protein